MRMFTKNNRTGKATDRLDCDILEPTVGNLKSKIAVPSFQIFFSDLHVHVLST